MNERLENNPDYLNAQIQKSGNEGRITIFAAAKLQMQ